MKSHTKCLIVGTTGVAIMSALTLKGAGPLAPSGSPAPTMKSLDEIEPRTPISSAPFTISASGSYYLTGNLAVTTGSAISINADYVTLDLNGFTISSTASPASGTGVLISGARRNVTVRNGHIRGATTYASGNFTTGGFLDGIGGVTSAAANLRVSDLHVSGVADSGIQFILTVPSRNIVERCSVSICATGGIVAGRVVDCYADTCGTNAITADIVTGSFGESVSTNVGNHGISGASVVENCRGIADAGFAVAGGTAPGNAQISNSFGTSNSSAGIQNAQGSVINCQGVSSSGAGIIGANVFNSAGSSTTGTGISAVGGTVSYSRGKRDGGVAITTFNAIGCTVSGTGTVTATNKSLGTP